MSHEPGENWYQEEAKFFAKQRDEALRERDAALAGVQRLEARVAGLLVRIAKLKTAGASCAVRSSSRSCAKRSR